MNILTIDVEEWFHLLDFDRTRNEEQWGGYQVRIYDNMERMLRILEDTGTKATFFIIGWIAKRYPDIVRMVAQRYQIGSHTMNHQLVWQQRPEEFREDLTSSLKLLEDITGSRVECFRAPGFSITRETGWAFEILHEAGIRYDSSIFPARHAHGGIPDFPKGTPAIVEYNGVRMKEFPINFASVAGRHFVFSGGGYFRLSPYPLIRRWSEESDGYMMAYLHPRDLDAGQPVLKGLPPQRRFKSYVGLGGAEKKLRKWLSDFEFTDIAGADRQIDWDAASAVRLIP